MASMDSIFRLSVIVNMVDNLTKPMVSVKNTTDDTVESLEKLQVGFNNLTRVGAVATGVGAAITGAVLSTVEATFETKRALGELSSLGVKDLELLKNKASEFSNNWAGTSKSEFITAAYDIKSGIASLTDEGVTQFTELSGMTATATKSSVSEMTNLFATAYGIYKGYYSDMNDLEFGEMFSSGISKSVQQFKTTGSGMSEAISSLGASATQAQVRLEEQLSILGMLQATMSGSEAGTKYSAFIKSAAKAGSELGLSFVDSNNKLIEMPKILEGLRSKYGETLDAIEKQELTKAFGTDEAVKMIELLYNKNEDLQGNIVSLYTSMSQGVTVTKDMANAINSTDYSKYELLKQKVQNTKETLGNALAPAVMDMISKIANLVDKFSAFASKNPEVTSAIMNIVLGFGAILTVSGGTIALIGTVGTVFIKLKSVFGLLSSSFKILKGGFDTFRIVAMYAGDGLKAFVGFVWKGISALPGLIGSVWSFTAALLANPVTWIVIVIVALIAVIILLWKNWDKVSEFLSNTWNNVVAGVGAGFNWIKGKLVAAGSFFTTIWTNITNGFKNAITNFLPNVLSSGKKIITTLVSGIKSVISMPGKVVKDGLQKIRNMLPFSDAKTGPLSKLTLSGKKIFTTISAGMNETKDIPAQKFSEAMNFTGDSDESNINIEDYKNKKISNIKEFFQTSIEKKEREVEKTKERQVIIEKLEVNLDIKDLKNLSLIEKVIEEIEDIDNSNPDIEDNIETIN